jgi:hypothetical protein
VRATRAALESQLERTRRRLERAIERGREYDLTSSQARAELREWASRLLHDGIERLGASARARVERVRELVERIDAYQSLIEKLEAAELTGSLQPA